MIIVLLLPRSRGLLLVHPLLIAEGGVFVAVFAANRRSKIAQAIAETTRDFRQPLWPQDKQRHDKHEQEMRRLSAGAYG